MLGNEYFEPYSETEMALPTLRKTFLASQASGFSATTAAAHRDNSMDFTQWSLNRPALHCQKKQRPGVLLLPWGVDSVHDTPYTSYKCENQLWKKNRIS